MKVEIDLDKVLAEAMQHMTSPDDLRWPLGMALQDLYWNEWVQGLQEKMISTYAGEKA